MYKGVYLLPYQSWQGKKKNLKGVLLQQHKSSKVLVHFILLKKPTLPRENAIGISPNQLQIKMSRIMLSHQHSLKFGNMWRNVNWKRPT